MTPCPQCGWLQRFQKLNEGDIRGPGRGADDTSEGKFTPSWIWLVPRPSHPPPTTSSDDPIATTIATNKSALTNDPELVDSMRAHWAKCQARAERYEEEVALTVEEMGRTLRYFEWKRSWWLSLESDRAKSDSPPPADVQHGLRAYAHRQANIYDTLIVSFVNRWRKILLSCGLNPTWLSQYPATTNSPSIQPPCDHPQLEAEPVAQVVDPGSVHVVHKPPSLPSPYPHDEDTDAPLTTDDNENGGHEDDVEDGDGDDDDDEYFVDTANVFAFDD